MAVKKIITVVGARPNFMKAAALHRALKVYPQVLSRIVHTGQHSSADMSDVFFRELDLPAPDAYLGIQQENPAKFMADVQSGLETILQQEQPDWVVVIGDVNSTLAAARAAHKLGIALAHVEAGLRSFDLTMQEENNRVQTDALSDLLFVTEPQGIVNLRQEGLSHKNICLVGNCLIDSIAQYREKAALTRAFERHQLTDKSYALLTFHRPANVDSKPALNHVVGIVEAVCQRYPTIFPLHPRTRKALERHGLLQTLVEIPGLQLPDPLGYLPFLNLLEHAAFVMTDSGGVQVESSWLDIPCITLRNTTESPACIAYGTNELLPEPDLFQLNHLLHRIHAQQWKKSRLSELWDGHAAERMAKVLAVLR